MNIFSVINQKKDDRSLILNQRHYQRLLDYQKYQDNLETANKVLEVYDFVLIFATVWFSSL